MARRRNRRWSAFGLLSIVVAVVASAMVLNTMVGRRGSTARVLIPTGSSLSAAADSLQSARVIHSALIFRVVAAVRGATDGAVVSGRYLVSRGSSMSALLGQLRTGSGRFRRLTIPEGWGIQQIARLAHDSLGLSVDSVVAATRDSARRARVLTTAADVEGYLFPATYDFVDGVTAGGVVDTMLLTFERRWKSSWDATLQSQGRSRHALVTLASIVEKEAGRSSDRALIAAVYTNRLRAGMRLQADPTVVYAMGMASKKRVLFADLRIDSPYNTYRVAGLPPGPIASPGTASLAAAVEPAVSDAMFFVAFPDGHSEFTKTFAEHTVAVKASRAARDTSSPR